MNSKLSTKQVIEKIHHEFNTAGEEILKEAKNIIDEGLLDKANRLERAGFSQSIEVKKASPMKVSKELVNNIMQYSIRYPDKKFITEDQVMIINEKYKLECAPIARYKGFVPDEKLKMIECFKLHADDLPEVCITNVKFSSLQTDDINLIKRKYPSGIYPVKEVQYLGKSNMMLNFAYVDKYDLIDNTGLHICAPKKQLDLKGLSKIGALFYSLTTVEIPDPVVLQPVKGGYLIIAAWGDEASDEIVVNQTMN